MNPEIWRHIFDAIDAPIFLHDQAYRVLLANRAYCREAGVAEAEALGKPYYEVFPRGRGPLPGCRDTLANGHAGNEDEVSVGGKCFLSTGYAVRDDQGKLLYALHILRDITAQRQAETALRRSEAEIRLLLDTLPQKIFYKDRDSVYVSCNASYARDLGIPAAEIRGRSDLDFYPQELAEKYRADDQRLMAACKPEDIEEAYLKDGQACWVHTVKTPMCGEKGEPAGILGIFWDVTALRQAQAHLVRLNRMFRTISLCNQALVRSENELALAGAMCRVLVEAGGYSTAWVGYAETSEAKRIRPMAAVGIDQDEIEKMNLTWEDNERGQGPTGSAVRTGEIVVSQDVLNDPAWAPWHETAGRLGVAAAAAFPLRINGHVLGAIDIYSAEPDAFAPDMIELLAEMAGDLAFGIGNHRTRAERIGILEKLELSLDHAVTAIAATVEMRDPYTAGHQRRVARLAAAIALEMGLPAQQVEGLRMAGVVHDIGKIHVPAEILSSPAKLSAAEFEIIKTHPLVGYDILKGIDFPWPVAEIVWQHHEKLDGSGYPRGLKGEEILIEARILTVADVVEAMASHRPYRPGFGIFPTLQEISRNKGKLYDERVAEACLRLFMERNYEL
ncbi:MAG: PAS domain-containing protein [Pseudomonadota bacterium]|nr:PAS domain-containing protein [Pseudomonadota bacterium]MDP1572701.1 PAS domain-containing protein [Pseudomonadota bacterium]MDP1906573.1 PAS domain-containing protein [Pseudomonadota bacterium]